MPFITLIHKIKLTVIQIVILAYSVVKETNDKIFSYCYIVISVMLKPLKQRLIEVTTFGHSKLLYSWPIPFNSTNNSVFVFPYHFDRRIYETKFLTHISFLFSIFYFLYHF